MKYDNKYFHPFSNMSFIYTGFTVSLITGKFLLSLLHIIHVSPTNLLLPVFQKIKGGRNDYRDDYRGHLLLKNHQVIIISASRLVFTIASTLDMVVKNCDSHDIAEKLLTKWR